MSEVSAEQIFENIRHGLEPWYWGVDPFGTELWEYTASEAELAHANEILVKHGLGPADKLYFGHQIEFGELTDMEGISLTQETASIHFHEGNIINLYCFMKYADSEEINAQKDLQVEDDTTDLVEALRAMLRGDIPSKDWKEYLKEMQAVSEVEMLALAGLTNILLNRYKGEQENS